MKNYNCIYCSTELTKKQIQTKNKYCSLECFSLDKYGKSYTRFIECLYCGNPFKQNRDKLKYCSKSCNNNSQKINGIFTEWRSILNWKKCHFCEKVFIAQSNNQKYCNSKCLKKSNKLRCEITIVNCESCGILHVSRNWRIKHICKICKIKFLHQSQIESRKKYKIFAKQRAKVIDYICIRDNWKCHICGLAVDKGKFNNSNPKSKTLDHIIPSSLGGSNDVSNLKLAHFSCNSSKGNRGGSEQLMLIG